MVKDAGFYQEYESLLAETNSFVSDAPRLKDLCKLRLMSIMRAEHLPYANQQNLGIRLQSKCVEKMKIFQRGC